MARFSDVEISAIYACTTPYPEPPNPQIIRPARNIRNIKESGRERMLVERESQTIIYPIRLKRDVTVRRFFLPNRSERRPKRSQPINIPIE